MSKKHRFKTLEFERLEDRVNPGILVPTGNAQQNPSGLFQAPSGPGMANGGSYRLGRYGVERENNDDTGFKENYWSSDVTFGATGYIDTVFRVENSAVAGTSEFRFEVNFTNATGAAWTSFAIELGFGVGNEFRLMDTIYAGTSLDLDWPHKTMDATSNSYGGPDEGVGFTVTPTQYPNLAMNRLHEHSVLAMRGVQLNNALAHLFFNVDIPNADGILGLRPPELQFNPTGYTFTIRMIPFNQNQAPQGQANSVSTLKNSDYTFALSDFGFSDPNDLPANAFNAVKITSLPAAGTLTNDGNAVNVNDFVSADDISSGLLVFTPATNATGSAYASFGFKVQDDGGTDNGGTDLDTSSRTMTINVFDSSWMNHSPEGANNTVFADEDSDYVFTTSDFGFSDSNDSPANNFLAVQITSIPSKGVLTDNGIQIQAGDLVSVAHVNSGLLIYSPEPEASGSSYTSFGFKVKDDGGSANGGSDLDSTARTLTIDLASTNDAPANIFPSTQKTDKNTDLIFSTANGNAIALSDADAGGSTVQVTLTGTLGTLTLAGTTGLSFSFSDANGTGAGDGMSDATMTFRGTIADINAALNGLTFIPSLSYPGSASLQITTNDLGNSGSGGPLTDNDIVEIIDPPVNSVPGSQATDLNTPLVFSTATSNQISIVHPDISSSLVQVTLNATHGKLSLSGTTGLSFSFSDVDGTSAGDGTDDATMTFRGTVSAINTALDGLTFTPETDYFGEASVGINTSDLGNTGSGTVWTDEDAVSISVGIATVTGLNLHSGSTAGGGTITITGTGFTATTDVLFDGVSVASFSIISDTTITATIPSHSIGDVFVTVVTSSASSPNSWAAQYSYLNNAPTQTGTPGSTITVNRDSANSTAVTLGLSGLAYSPGPSPESGQTLTYKITGIPSYINLFLADGTTAVAVNDTLTLSQLQGLKYKTVAGMSGSDSLTWTIQDNGGKFNGGEDTLNQSLAINVRSGTTITNAIDLGSSNYTGLDVVQNLWYKWTPPSNGTAHILAFMYDVYLYDQYGTELDIQYHVSFTATANIPIYIVFVLGDDTCNIWM